ncbi:EcsC family protein [Pontibacter korlensis]|uniref:EcsC n=1 Tax=Pontibacter korlensis TaxID=400092 RepID=A0A0E3UY65_9BACT|nr:EcsC family protein [Pontibacter korlensis]AKD04181.1 ecsC [Pontibacter korlensis]
MPTLYEIQAEYELRRWQHEMLRNPSVFNEFARKAQVKLNSYIPEKVHQAITTAIKQMIRGVLFGAGFVSPKPLLEAPLDVREAMVRERIKYYQQAAAAEGGVTGAGGILLGFVDFPLLLGLKLKLLYDIAAFYGYDVKDYRERVYLLHIFELAFSSQEHRRKIYLHIADWETQKLFLPEDINEFDWRSLQQEYRDYIDLAKMAQMIPFIGAPIGAVVNYRLISKLGKTAMNAYRMRWQEQGLLQH